MSDTKQGIEFDEGAREVLLICHDCAGVWRAFAWTRDEAEQAAAGHEERCHPGTTTIRDRIAARHAMRKKRANAARC